MAELTQDQHLRLETLLNAGSLSPEQTKRVKALLKTPAPIPKGTREFGGAVFPEGALSDPDIVGGKERSPFDVPGGERAINEFFSSPEGQRVILEAAGGTLGALFPPARLVKPVVEALPRAGPIITRSFQAGAGEAAGSLVAETVDPSVSPAKSAAASFGLGAAGGAAGEAVIPVAKKVLAPFVKKLEPGARTLIKTVTGKGGVVTPGTALDFRSLDLLENIAEASLFGAGKLRSVKQQTRSLMQESVEEFAETFASRASKEDIGEVLQHTIEQGADAFRAAGRVKYRRVDKLASGINVPTFGIKRAMQAVADKSKKGLGSAAIKRISRRIEELGDVESFASLQELRSDLLAVARSSTDLVAGKAQGAGKFMANRVDMAMANAAKNLNPEALVAFREASAFWKQGKQTFNSSFIKGLARKDADVVYQSAVRDGRPLLIRKLRETIADPNVWKDVQGQFFADTLSKAADTGGIVSGESLLKQLKKFGEPALKELFPDGSANTFRNLARALKLSQQAASEEGTGRLFIQFTQGGALLNLAGGGPLPTASALVLLAPPTMARLFTNRTIARWLTIGLKAPPGSSEAIRASAQVVAAMQKEGLIERLETK